MFWKIIVEESNIWLFLSFKVKFGKEGDTVLLTSSLDGLINLYNVTEYTEDDALQQTYNINSSVVS